MRKTDKWIRKEYADFPEMLRLLDENREQIRQQGFRSRLWLWLHDRDVRVRLLEQPILPRLRALPRHVFRGLGAAVGWIVTLVFTWGIAFRLAYGHYRGDWLSFWIIVGAWMVFSCWLLIWMHDHGLPKLRDWRTRRRR